MPTIEQWKWRVYDPDRERHVKTSCHLSEADARTLDPDAERIEGTRRVLDVPDDLEAMRTSAWQRQS